MSMLPYKKRKFDMMRTAGPYLTRTIQAYPGRYQAAFRAGRYVFENRDRIAQAARIIQKAAKSYRSRKNRRENFSPSNIGKDIGTADTKKNGVLDDDDVAGGPIYNTRTLYKRQLVVVPPGMADNQRMGTAINLKGIKICTNWMHAQMSNGNGLNCHLAIIAPKENNAKTFAAGEFEQDFFGAWGFNGSNRALDFGIQLSSIDFDCYPINTDKWVVLKHIRLDLATFNANHSAFDSYKKEHFYLKINRQVQFSSMAEDALPDNPIYMVWWCDNWMEEGGFAGRANELRMEAKAILYFSDICKC